MNELEFEKLLKKKDRKIRSLKREKEKLEK